MNTGAAPIRGVTLKQYRRERFAHALTAYRRALETGEGIAAASLAVHAAKETAADRAAVNRVFRTTQRQTANT